MKSNKYPFSSFGFAFVALFAWSIVLLAITAPASALKENRNAPGDAKNLKQEKFREYAPEDAAFLKKFLKPGTYMLPSEIKTGMEGYGLSVFRGSKIERFQVKVIGVMKRVINGKDAILVRLSGPTMGKNNVIRGMSGSPVYINDKLIGAISYGFDFSLEPIAGVTPIVDMLDSLAKPQDAPGSGNKLETGEKEEPIGAVPPRMPLSPYTISGLSPDLSKIRRQMVATSSPHMVPLLAPVALSGFSNRAHDYLSKRFEHFGLSVSEGTGGGLDADLPREDLKELSTLKPGSAVGVMLTTGDFESAATGTVTTTFGDRVIAFGHPFVQAGMVDFPMTSAYIHEVLPSLSISFKMSSPVKLLGTVYADRPWSIGGQLGSKAKMVPVSIEVSDEARRVKRSFNSQVIDHQDLTPELISACTMSAIDATYQSSIPYVAYVHSIVETDKTETINRSDCLSNSYGGAGMASSVFKGPLFADPVAANIYAITARVLSNKYEKVHLKRVSLKIRLDTGRNLTRIVRVSTDRSQVKPGESVKVNCTLAPYNGAPYQKTLELPVPRDVADGELVIGVSGGTQLEELRRRMGIIDPPNNNLAQIVRRIQDRPEGDKLFAVLALPNQAIHVDGEVIQSPPGHWTKLFFSNRYTHGPALVNGERRAVSDVDTLLEGSHILAVEVKRGDDFMARQPWYQAQTKGSGKANLGFYITSQAQKAIDSMGKGDNKKSDGNAPANANETSANQPGAAARAPSAPSLWSPGLDDPHIRSMQVWSQAEESAFKGGARNGVTVDGWGRMFPAFQERGSTRVESALRAWSGVWSQGSFYLASSNRLYKVADISSSPQEIAKIDCVAIPCMVSDSSGRLYIAIAPGAKILKVEPGTGPSVKVTTFAELPEQLISSLCFDGDDNLYAGSAGSGKVYKISQSGAVRQIFDSGQAHVTSMFFDRQTESLLVGCGEQGNVYSLERSGSTRALFHSDDHLITGVCRTRSGDLFVTTAGDGHLYRVMPNGDVIDMATSEAFYSLLYHPETGAVFAGDAEGDITEIQEEPLTGNSFFVPVKHTTQEAVVSLSADASGNLYALSSNLPAVYKFSIKPDTASFISPVKDGGRVSTWSHARLYGAFNETSPELQKLVALDVRSGNTPLPDQAWSEWLPTAVTDDGFAIRCPAARYLQYRIRWVGHPSRHDAEIFPWGRESVIGRVAVTYQPTNLPPRYTSVSLRSGAYLADSEEITIVGNDPDGDSLSLNIEISSDRGKTWKMLKEDLRPEKAVSKPNSAEKSKNSPRGKNSNGKDESDKDRARTKKDSASTPGATAGDVDSAKDKDKSESSKPSSGKPEQRDPEQDKPDQYKPDRGKSSQEKSDHQDRQGREKADQDKSDQEKPDKPSQEKPEQDESGNSTPDENESGKKDSDKDEAEKGETNKKESSKKPQAKKDEDKKADAKPGDSDKSTPAEAADRKKSPGEEQTEKFVYSLPTKTFKDGHYIIRFTLSDLPSNMARPQELRCYRYIVIDNGKPKIETAGATVEQGDTLSIRAEAVDDTSPIVNATFTVEGCEPRAFAVEGHADSQAVKLFASGVKLKKGAHKVEIEIMDKANNKANKTVKISGR